MIGSVFKRLVHPRHLWRVLRPARGEQGVARAYDDPQLKLYADIFPAGFLHYGYFDDPNVQPQDISLNDVLRAQRRHSEWVLGLIADKSSPVLDVGCGMGGLVGLMLDQGLKPTALSPDRNQIRHVQSKYPQVPTIHAKFEDIPASQYEAGFGTIITSESLQYLKLDVALPLMARLLKPGGRWIAYDYFCFGPAHNKSGHQWADFEKRVQQAGWRFVHQQDHTPHVLPTLKYVHMWGDGVARPLMQFSFGKLKRKLPRVHYLLEELLETVNRKFGRALDVVNPDRFAAEKKYMLLALERTR